MLKTTIEIDGKPVVFKASAAIPRIYRIKFRRDIYKDLRLLEKSVGENDEDDFADVLAAASSNANTNVSMMGETFKYVAPVAGALGYSVEDTATVIGVLANNGIKCNKSLHRAYTQCHKNNSVKYLERHQNKHLNENASYKDQFV